MQKIQFDAYYFHPYLTVFNLHCSLPLFFVALNGRLGLRIRIYTDFYNYAYTWKRLSSEELKTLDIGARLFDNAAFLHI